MGGRFKLNHRFFNQERMISTSILQSSYDTRLSRPTLMKYLGADESELTRIDGKVLYTILTDGMGLSADEIQNMTVGQLFELVDDEA